MDLEGPRQVGVEHRELKPLALHDGLDVDNGCAWS